MSQHVLAPTLLAQAFLPERDGAAGLARRAALVAGGVAALALASKVQVPLWPSPVPINLGSMAALAVGAAYGARLGLVTVLVWLALGALGADVFAGSASGATGLAYLLGGTGGYLAGYAAAVAIVGALAARGWSRRPLRMAGALVLGHVALYALGLLWLRGFAADWTQTLAWGLTPFLVGDAIKIALVTLAAPLAWRAAR
ncbi:MAG: biotin transporter BioY [Pseudomonadota bacterium]|nr:biotin transporter BioY [Pseudomonadota bacterium]